MSVGHTTASSSTPVLRADQSSVLDAGLDDSRPAADSSQAPSNSTPTSVSKHSVQMSLPQAFERKRKYQASHPQAIALNVHFSTFLALEMLPFRPVDTEAFLSLIAVAVLRYSVPSRHYFSRCAVSTLQCQLCPVTLPVP